MPNLPILIRRIIPNPLRRWVKSRWLGTEYRPPPGSVRFGDLRRLRPIGRRWGSEWGKPVDRYYIERFLAGHEPEIRGHVLEIGDDRYTRMFGADRVTESDVLHPDVSATNATIIADLSCAPEIPSDSFDCVVLTQVLQFVKDPRAVVRTLYRILRPGGVVLATTAGISQVSRWDMERWGDYWRYTDLSVAALFASAFSEPGVQVRTYGNVLTTTAFLHGLAMEELLPAELEYHDPDYQLVIGIRAQKTAAACEAMTGLDSAAPS